MKSAEDPRHKKRRSVIKELFSTSFAKQAITENLSKRVLKRLQEIDNEIKKSAPAWPIEKINKVDLAILRLGTYELIYTNTPPKVVIDEAVELAKEFGNDNSASFVNGVLGDILGRYEKKN